MKKSVFIYLLLPAFLLIGAGCKNQGPTTALPPSETPAVSEKQKESVTELPASNPLNTNSISVSIDKDFRITNVGNSDKIGDPVASVLPIYAYMCDIYDIRDGVPLHYSKVDFFISKDKKNSPVVLLGTTPGGSGGSDECDLLENESALNSQLEPGKYRMWAVRYIDNKPDKRTSDVFVTVK